MSKDIVRTSKTLYLHRLYNEILDDYCDTNNVFVYKIGETDYDNGGLRRVALGKNNSANLDTLIDSCSHECPLYHPTAIDKRFTDRCVINRIKETHGDIFRDPPRKVFKTLGITDGLTEIFTVDKKYSTEDVRKIVLQEYNYCKNNGPYIKNKETAEEQEINKLKNTYVVSQKLVDDTNLIYDAVEKLPVGSKILMLRQFSNSFITELLTRGFLVYNMIDNINASVEISSRFMNYRLNKNITAGVVDQGADMKNSVNELNTTFDLMIANPPYNVGGGVIEACRKYCKESVVLAPGSIYGEFDLSKHVKKIKPVSNEFNNAVIKNLTIALLDNNTNNNLDYITEFIQFRYDSTIKNFVNENIKHITDSNKIQRGGDNVLLESLDINNVFVVSGRVFDNGGHTKASATDRLFNLEFRIENKKKYGCGLLKFNSRAEKLNFSRFYYLNPIMNQLITGAHCSGLTPEINNVVPHIDWSVDRDYEHLTLDDLINILKEENK